MKYSVVIVAAGNGSRMGLGYNKAYYRLDHLTIIEHTMNIFVNDDDCEKIIVVTSIDDYHERVGIDAMDKVVLTEGGSTRQESVYQGLKLVDTEYVLIHDGARPYLSKECLEHVKKAVEEYGAACLMVPCKDTIKKVEDGFIQCTIERSTVQAAQTPQAFRTDIITKSMQCAMENHYFGTDDCSLVEKFGNVRIRIVEGSFENLKITTPEDLKR